MKPERYRLHNKAASGSLKNKEFRMVGDKDGNLCPRDHTFPLSALQEAAGGKFKKTNATKVQP